MDNISRPARVPLGDPPQRGVEIELIVDGERHILDQQEAADVIHYLFPNAPVPVRVELHWRDPDTGVTSWLADLDPLTYQRTAAGVDTYVLVNGYEGTITA